MKFNLIFWSICSFCFSLNSCSPSIIENKNKPNETNKLTQIAIFQYFNSSNLYHDQTFSKGPIKLDPLLCIRDTINMDDTLYFSKPMDSDELKHPILKKSYRLIIPDSLSNKFRYTSTEDNYVHDYATIYQFSPLLPTLKPNLFLIQNYIWVNTCGDMEDTLCCRTASRRYLKFRIERKKVTFLEPIGSSDEASDFEGLRCFSRSKLENNKEK